MNWPTLLESLLHLLSALVELAKSHEMLDSLLFTALVVTMPVPGSPFNWKTIYTWIYDAVHQFWNLRNPRTPLPTLPAEATPPPVSPEKN